MSLPDLMKTVAFSSKGQVVIPAHLRKLFGIERGTRAVVQAVPEGILIKAVTGALIRRARGIVPRGPQDMPLVEDWAAHRREEWAIEERHAR